MIYPFRKSTGFSTRKNCGPKKQQISEAQNLGTPPRYA